MLKGNVKVTLYDKDGNVIECQEKSNLVTDATAKILNYCAGANRDQSTNLVFYQMPVAEKLLGGLLLFDDAITGSGDSDPTADMVIIPNNVRVTACADRTQDSANAKRGSFNAYSSGRVPGGYKSVWDFGTEQGNGDVASIALTSLACGANPFGCYTSYTLKGVYQLYDTNGTLYTVGNGIPLKYDVYTQTYYFLFYEYTSGGHKYTLCYARIPFYTFNVEDTVYEMGQFTKTENSILLPSNTIQMDFSCIDTIGGYAYLGYNLSSGTLNYVKLSLDFSTFTYSDETRGDVNMRYAVSNGIWYILNGDKQIVAKNDRGDIATYNTEKDSSTYSTNNNRLIAKSNGTVVVAKQSDQKSGWVLYPPEFPSAGQTVHIAGEVDYITASTETTSDCGFYFDTDLLTVYQNFRENVHYFNIKPDYLGTIFNLDTPVAKTSTTNMKIEYTLTNVTSEQQGE